MGWTDSCALPRSKYISQGPKRLQSSSAICLTVLNQGEKWRPWGAIFFPTKLAHRQQKRMKEKCSLSNNKQRKSGISQCIMQNTQSQQLSSSETKWPSDKIHWPSTRKKHPRQTMTMIQHRSSIHCGWSLRNEIEGEGRRAVFALHCNGHYPKWMRRDNKNGPAVPVE